MKEFNILSLGAGVQSSTVAMLSVEGIIPKYDAWVFADTGWEPQEVYDQLSWLKEKAEEIGTAFYSTMKADVREFSKLRDKRAPSIPVYTRNRETGKVGILRRQCTAELKIFPVEKVIREKIIGVKPRKWVPKDTHVNISLGISTDEMQRVSKSRHKWATHKYPLLELKWDREKCLTWFSEMYDKNPPRSACLCCPYHNNDFFRNLSDKDLKEVIQFDKDIRNLSDTFEYFINRDRIPISELDLQKDNGASFLDECSGLCGN